MSFDVFVLGFHGGDSVAMPSAAFHDVFGPHIDRTEPQHGYWHVTATDGGEADIYARIDGDTFESLMFTRFSDGDVLDLLAAFARRSNAVIMPIGCPTCLTTPDQLKHLPDELASQDAILVANGRDIANVISSN
jgi:hypothetical protein